MRDATTNHPGESSHIPSSSKLEEFRSKFRLDLEIEVLKADLDLKRLQANRMQLTGLTEDEIQTVLDEEFRAEPDLVELAARVEEIKERIKDEFPDPVTYHYDHPKQLQITIHYPDRPSVTIDILKSLRANPRNIGHPLIADAIAHYARQARSQVEAARNSLERVLKALVLQRRLREEDRPDAIGLSMYLNSLPEKYFESLWDTLRSNEAIDLREGKDKTKWLKHVKEQIQSLYPEVDHTTILAFLRRYPELIPHHCGGQPAGAFKNAILSCKLKLEFDSIKTVRSRVPFYRMSQSPLSETDWEQLGNNYLRTLTDDLTKTSTMRPYEDLSKLVIVNYDPPK